MDVTKKTDEVIEKTEDAEAPDTEPTEDTEAPDTEPTEDTGAPDTEPTEDTGTPDSGVSEDMSLYQKKQKRLSLLNGIALGIFALCMVVMQAMSLLHIDVIVDGKYAGALLMPVIFIPLALMLVRGILSVRLAGKHKQSSSSDALVLVLTAAVTLVFGVLTVMYMNGENSRNQELVCENLTLREGQSVEDLYDAFCRRFTEVIRSLSPGDADPLDAALDFAILATGYSAGCAAALKADAVAEK